MSYHELLKSEDLAAYESDTEFVEAYGDEGFEKVRPFSGGGGRLSARESPCRATGRALHGCSLSSLSLQSRMQELDTCIVIENLPQVPKEKMARLTDLLLRPGEKCILLKYGKLAGTPATSFVMPFDEKNAVTAGCVPFNRR